MGKVIDYYSNMYSFHSLKKVRRAENGIGYVCNTIFASSRLPTSCELGDSFMVGLEKSWKGLNYLKYYLKYFRKIVNTQIFNNISVIKTPAKCMK